MYLSFSKHHPLWAVCGHCWLHHPHRDDACNIEDSRHSSQLVGVYEFLGQEVHLLRSQIVQSELVVVTRRVCNLNNDLQILNKLCFHSGVYGMGNTKTMVCNKTQLFYLNG